MPNVLQKHFSLVGESLSRRTRHGTFGMRLHVVHLSLQFQWVGPIVVALTDGTVFCADAACGFQHHAAQTAVGFRVEILFLKDRHDDVGILLCIFANDVGSAVGDDT